MITSEEAKQKVEDLGDVLMNKLSNWEVDFISDMEDREEFTEGQLIRIEELWEKYCAN